MPLKSTSANRKDINTAANGVTLEHRHFSFIAAAISDLRYTMSPDEVTILAVHFARRCEATNPKFNEARFLAACGVE